MSLYTLVISQMRLWAIYHSKFVFYVMTVVIFLALVSMGMIEGFASTNLHGT